MTAVGAVVAAGLTPGIIAATPGCLPGQGSNAEITAADVVAIDGLAYGFDELYAMQQPDSVEMNEIVLDIVLEPDTTAIDLHGINYGIIRATKYGAPRGRVSPISLNFEVIEGDTIYRSVERAPSFPDGDAALQEYIKTHIKYPAKALKNRIEGRVVVQFVVDKKGKIGEVKVVRSVDKDLDKEAVRVVKSLPDFIPARLGNQAVSAWHTLPVIFNLPQKKQ